MVTLLHVKDTGIVYRNPKPHLRAVHAWHPSVVVREDGELVCSFDLGQAVESLDYRTYISRSSDDGQFWSPPRRLMEGETRRPSTHTIRISRMSDGSLVGFGARFYRDDPEEGLTNRDNLGFVPMELVLLRSDDGGYSWSRPAIIEPPLIGPAFEICHRIVELSDGRWIAPTQTWRGWNGEAPHGMKAVALVSHDRGCTWPEYIDILDGNDQRVIHFEQSVVELQAGRLLAVAWAYEENTGKTRPTPYTIAPDGRTFSPLRETGLRGQTAKLLALPDDRVACLYRREDEPGLWANLARIDGDAWINIEQIPVWQGAPSGMENVASTSEGLGSLKFGFPTLIRLPDGDIFAVFWCHENDLYIIRWVRIGL